MNYYIAFDGGGSKLAAILFDENLHLVSSAVGASMNQSTASRERIGENARKCVDTLIGNTGVKRVECIYGVFTPVVAEQVAAVVEVGRTDDRGGESLVGLNAAFVFGDAITALSGTGSVIFYTHDGRVDEAGGYGSIVCDEGSGYDMGRRAFAAAIHDFEGRGEHTKISECICRKLGVKNIPEAADRIYNMPEKVPVAAVASIATCVGEAKREGDETAAALLRYIGEIMADQTLGLIRRTNPPINVPVVLSGGHFKNDRLISETFIECMKKENPGRPVVVPYFEPIVGAVIAHRTLNGVIPDAVTIEQLKKEYSAFRFVIK